MNWLFYLIIFLFGLIVGSFLDCLVSRLRKKETILGRSVCPYCRHRLGWLDLIPLVSFVIFRGKCRYCRRPISWEYPAVELGTAILFVLAAWFFLSNPLLLVRNLFIVGVLIFLFLYDLKEQIILDKIILPAILIVFIFNIFLGFSLTNYLLAASLITLFFAFQWIISRGRWIGGGDLRLGFLLGLIVGWPSILLVLVLAYLSGAMVGIYLMLTKQKKLTSAVPFAPFLVFGALIVLFWAAEIVNFLVYF